MSKRIIALLLVVILVMSTCAFGTRKDDAKSSVPDAESIVLKLGHGNAIDTPIDNTVELFAEKVAEYTDGRITIDIYPASQLGSIQEMVEAVEMGTLDMTLGEVNLLSALRPEFVIFSLPMLVTSYEMAYAAFDLPEVNDLVEQMAAEDGVRQLCWWFQGYRHLITEDPITSLADCKGVKLRSPEADNYIQTFTIMGFNPVVIPWGDTFTALSTGLADGCDTSLEGMYNADLYTVVKNICLSAHMCSVNGLTINEDVWQGLSEEDQEAIMKAVDEVTEQQREENVVLEEEYQTKLEDEGVNFTKFEDPQEINDAFMDYWTEAAEVADAVDLLNEVIALGQ